MSLSPGTKSSPVGSACATASSSGTCPTSIIVGRAGELLIDAALELRRRGVDATALIVGDGSRREVLEAHAVEREAGDAVHFTGRIPHDRVSQYYAQLDVFVIPRINERAARLVTPLKPFEAMAPGLPTVVSDLPALQEITGNGDRGLTFTTGDASSLADVLEGPAASPTDRRGACRQGAPVGARAPHVGAQR
ncbi:glycosyltransferase [Janibacter limosus]|uniref:Glycosyltransferase n=1 Tax=Janibacter limosus TaxID=53458 RepID=A0AC61U4Z7_9MICO|nr:glycosyltransferase [Janibacter limosus]UUZ45107.1 glycosyltransferase [Janibacter limosus]